MNKPRSLAVILGLSLVMLIATFSLVLTASAQTGGDVDQIVIRSQDTNRGQIIVDSVTAAQDGWLVVYTDTSVSPRTMVGWVPIHKGVNTNLKVDINRELVEPYATLWAVLHVDRGVIGLMEISKIDGPAQQDGKIVMVAFGTQAPPAAIETPRAAAPVAVAGPPEVLPVAGGAGASPLGWFLLAGVGVLLGAMGLALPCVRARSEPAKNATARPQGTLQG